MGTRHLTIIRKNGEVKLAQYGQWDGRPSAQGLNLLRILKGIDIQKLSEITDTLTEVTEEKFDTTNTPEYSRDTGTNIITLIYDKGVREIQIDRVSMEPNNYIEGTFEINFDTNEYICCGKVFLLDSLPDEETFLLAF